MGTPMGPEGETDPGEDEICAVAVRALAYCGAAFLSERGLDLGDCTTALRLRCIACGCEWEVPDLDSAEERLRIEALCKSIFCPRGCTGRHQLLLHGIAEGAVSEQNAAALALVRSQ